MAHTFIKDRNIVLFSFQPWDTEIGSNFKDMAVELAKLNRVLYVNRALDRASLWKGKYNPQVQTRLASIRRGKGELVQVQPGLWVQNPRTILESINWIPFAAIHDRLNKINNIRLSRQINKMIHRLKFTNVILINDNDFIRGRYLRQLVHCSDYIFYKRDYMLGVGYFRRHGPRLESGILEEADLVVTNSEYLASQARKINKNSYDMGQGCYPANFLENIDTVPDDIKNMKGPVIGYTGYISAWRIDVDILVYIARQLPECSIVLVGPVDILFQIDEVKDLGNIFFLGTKPADELPAYIKQFDVCINPQVLNEMTMGNYPRKIDEYLAMGKPVVATATETMELFKDYCLLCTDKREFVENIKKVIGNQNLYSSQDEINKRKAFASTHTWTNSIGRLGDAYYAPRIKADLPDKPVKVSGYKKPWLQVLATVFIIIYLLFIFVKFLFY
ncbi:MAG: glycosyltransferase [Chitinophagaceae bacterium]